MLLNFTLLLFLLVCAAAAVRMKDLLGSVVMLCAYSLTMTLIWTTLNAVDVALTEAAVGAGIVTVLLIAALGRTASTEDTSLLEKEDSVIAMVRRALPFLAVMAAGALLVYGTLDMPDYNALSAPANRHVAATYITGSVPETGVVNFVTSILAAYRGFDTFGETAVIVTAAVCAGLVLTGKERK